MIYTAIVEFESDFIFSESGTSIYQIETDRDDFDIIVRHLKDLLSEDHGYIEPDAVYSTNSYLYYDGPTQFDFERVEKLEHLFNVWRLKLTDKIGNSFFITFIKTADE